MQRVDAFVAAMFLTVLACACPRAMAQGFMGGGTAYDPEVGVVESGAKLDATATVSADRRYVTITARADNSDLRELVLFPVVDIGFVGGANPGGDAGVAGVVGEGDRAPAAAAANLNNGINTSPTAIANQATVLNRRGMFLLAKLE
jgi:hypothetical protein